MKLINVFLGLLFAALTAALLPIKDMVSSASTSSNPTVEPRQILTDGDSKFCCDNCNARYGYDDLWYIFEDLCQWLGGAQTLWTSEEYDTRNIYCQPEYDPNICVRAFVEYDCGGSFEGPVSESNPAGAMRVEYNGCMGYFQETIEPAGFCGGPPFPGGKVISANGCWAFSFVSQDSPYTMSALSKIAAPIDDDCEPGAKLCPVAKDANGTALESPFSGAKFGPAVVQEVA